MLRREVRLAIIGLVMGAVVTPETLSTRFQGVESHKTGMSLAVAVRIWNLALFKGVNSTMPAILRLRWKQGLQSEENFSVPNVVTDLAN